MKARPAIQTELPVIPHNLAATGATRRQRIIQDRAQQMACPFAGERQCRIVLIVIPPGHPGLVNQRQGRHKAAMIAPPTPTEIFCRRRHRAQRDRMGAMGTAANFLAPIIADSLLDRLAMVRREFSHALLIGAHDPALIAALRPIAPELTITDAGFALAATQSIAPCDEDRLDFGTAAFDLIIWPGGLESVNDVPGALLRLRAMLAPDGLLIGTLIGDGSLPCLRRALTGDGVRAIPRLHPQIDIAAMGNLLQRIGFALPVADVESLAIRYGPWRDLIRDLRACGLSSRLTPSPPPIRRDEIPAITRAWHMQADTDGRVTETLRLIQFSGWAPHPDQPKPARRGSALHSLADALKPPARG